VDLSTISAHLPRVPAAMGANPAHRSPAQQGTFISQAVPHQAHTPGGKVELGAVDLDPEMVEAIAQAALRAGLTVAAWRRRAYKEQLQREKA
jgi:hypothetical protein